MKKEKQVRSYKRRTKSGKIVTVKAHTAKYDADDDDDEKAKGISKKEGAGKELEERKKKSTKLEIPLNKEEEKKVLDRVKDEEKKSAEKKTTKKVRSVGSGTNGPTPKRKSEAKVTKTTASKPTTSEPAFTAAEFKEWYRGTGSAADKKVAKALRAQLGRSGYRKLEDEAIDNYSSRGHLSMFKKVSSGSSSQTTPKQPTTKDIALSKVSVPKGYTLNGKPRKFKDDEGSGHKVAATDKNGNKVTLYRYDDKTASKLGENNKKWSLEFGSELPNSGTGTNGPKSKSKEPISEQSLNSKGFKTFKMPQIGTLYLGKRGKGAYIKFKGKKNIQKADIDDYEDFITGHNGLTRAQKKQLSSLGYTEHEEY